MILLNAKGKITLHNNKTNLIHRFDVPNGLKALKISFEYSPKTLENREKAIEEVKACLEKYDEVCEGRPDDYLPIKNLVTLSLDANGRYIGAAHRQSNKQEHIISADKSSVGFIKTEIEQGEWDIMLNVHSVSCDIYYKIIVEGEE